MRDPFKRQFRVFDEGGIIPGVTGVNFVGAGVTATGPPPNATCTIPGAGAALIATATIAFTNGDTYQRVTISDANATTTSKIVGTIRRPDGTDLADTGAFIYLWAVVRRQAGSFDLAVAVQALGQAEPWLAPPNETVNFDYLLG